jgi:hypothetical protein
MQSIVDAPCFPQTMKDFSLETGRDVAQLLEGVLCYVMLCCVMLSYVILCHVVLRYVMSCYVT